MSDRKMLTAKTWVEAQKNGLIRVSLWLGEGMEEGTNMSACLTERGARDLIRKVTTALESLPRVASAADLGITEAV